MNTTQAILIVAFCSILGALGQVFFKLSSKYVTLDILSWVTNWRLIIGLTLYGIATIAFIWTLRSANLSILYPVVATSYIWVAVFSTFFLGEPFMWYKWFGIAAILLGVSIIVL